MAECIAPSSNTFEWQLVGPIAPYVRLGTIHRVPKSLEVKQNSHYATSQCGSLCYAAGNTKLQHPWESHHLLEFALGCPTRMEELLYIPQWGGTTQSLRGSHCSAESWTCWNTLSLEWNIHHWKWEKSRGHYWQIPPAVLMTNNAHLANMYGMYHQVKFLKLTTSISSRSGGQCSVFDWYDHLIAISLFPRWPGRHHIIQRTPY